MARSSEQLESDTLPRWACTICYEEAENNPVLTSCGHLFCWPCLYSWMGNIRIKPCPVCRTPLIVDANIHPIYNSGLESNPSGSSIPPRPRPIIRPALLPPEQNNTAWGLPRGMQRVAAYGATSTIARVEVAAGREQAAREEAQVRFDLASNAEDIRNLNTISQMMEEMRVMGRSEAPHASGH